MACGDLHSDGQSAAPLAQTDRIVMYGDGNSTRMVKDVMNSASQIMEGVKESTGIDINALLAGAAGAAVAKGLDNKKAEKNAD